MHFYFNSALGPVPLQSITGMRIEICTGFFMPSSRDSTFVLDEF